MGYIKFHDSKSWQKDKGFINNVLHLPDFGVTLLGYFPYAVAKILPDEMAHGDRRELLLIPRDFFKDIEQVLVDNHILNNKAVYIFKSINSSPDDDFVLMLKDSYAIIGTWEEVVDMHNKPL